MNTYVLCKGKDCGMKLYVDKRGQSELRGVHCDKCNAMTEFVEREILTDVESDSDSNP